MSARGQKRAGEDRHVLVTYFDGKRAELVGSTTNSDMVTIFFPLIEWDIEKTEDFWKNRFFVIAPSDLLEGFVAATGELLPKDHNAVLALIHEQRMKDLQERFKTLFDYCEIYTFPFNFEAKDFAGPLKAKREGPLPADFRLILAQFQQADTLPSVDMHLSMKSRTEGGRVILGLHIGQIQFFFPPAVQLPRATTTTNNGASKVVDWHEVMMASTVPSNVGDDVEIVDNEIIRITGISPARPLLFSDFKKSRNSVPVTMELAVPEATESPTVVYSLVQEGGSYVSDLLIEELNEVVKAKPESALAGKICLSSSAMPQMMWELPAHDARDVRILPRTMAQARGLRDDLSVWNIIFKTACYRRADKLHLIFVDARFVFVPIFTHSTDHWLAFLIYRPFDHTVDPSIPLFFILDSAPAAMERVVNERAMQFVEFLKQLAIDTHRSELQFATDSSRLTVRAADRPYIWSDFPLQTASRCGFFVVMYFSSIVDMLYQNQEMRLLPYLLIERMRPFRSGYRRPGAFNDPMYSEQNVTTALNAKIERLCARLERKTKKAKK